MAGHFEVHSGTVGTCLNRVAARSANMRCFLFSLMLKVYFRKGGSLNQIFAGLQSHSHFTNVNYE